MPDFFHGAKFSHLAVEMWRSLFFFFFPFFLFLAIFGFLLFFCKDIQVSEEQGSTETLRFTKTEDRI